MTSRSAVNNNGEGDQLVSFFEQMRQENHVDAERNGGDDDAGEKSCHV